MNINHRSVSVYIIFNFLVFHANRFDRAYSMIAVYKKCIEMFGWKPKPKFTRLPTWVLNQLLELFTTGEFWPPERCAPFRLQKTLVLFMLSSGRRIHEIAVLTDNYRREKDKKNITLFWPEVLSPKTIAEILFLRTPQLGRCPIGLYRESFEK